MRAPPQVCIQACMSTPWRRLAGRRFVRLSATAALLLSAVALCATLLLPGSEDHRASPRRHTLVVDEARVADEQGVQRLIVTGTTSLPDRCDLAIVLLAGDREVLRLATATSGGRFALDSRAQGAVVEGRYLARVTFDLEGQTQATREALHYDPRELAAIAHVVLPPQLTRATEVKGELRGLFDSLSRAPRDAAVQDDVARRLDALDARLWLVEQRAALRSLRLAVAEARRPAFEREAFERLLLEAHVLAGL